MLPGAGGLNGCVRVHPIAQDYDITLGGKSDLSAGEQISGHRRLYYIASDAQRCQSIKRLRLNLVSMHVL